MDVFSKAHLMLLLAVLVGLAIGANVSRALRQSGQPIA